MGGLMRFLLALAWVLVVMQVVLLVISTTWFIFGMFVYTLVMAGSTTWSVRSFEQMR